MDFTKLSIKNSTCYISKSGSPMLERKKERKYKHNSKNKIVSMFEEWVLD
jgi:hypothetical protein